MVKRILIVVAILIVGLLLAERLRNPERADLDDAARQQVSGRFVRLGDGMTHYDVSGPDSGQRVLLVHGFSVPSYIWDSTVAALTGAGFRVARYDEYGRGFSDRPDVEYSVDLLDRQLSQLLDSLGWKDSVDVVGLSMGGIVVGTFTGRHPERVRSMTLIDPAAGDVGGLPWYFAMPVLGPVLWQTLAVPGMAAGQLSDFVDPSRWPGWPDKYRVQMRYRGFGRALRSTLATRTGLRSDTLYARVGARGTRSLLIWGREDKTVTFDHAEGVRKAIPQIRFEPIDRAGHLPQMERTDVVNPILISFLKNEVVPVGGQPKD